MFWLPLLALAGALVSDAEEDKPRWRQGDPLNRSIFDLISEIPELKLMVGPLSDYLQSLRSPTYRDAAIWLSQQGLGDPNTAQFAQIGFLLYALARAKPYRAIWKLEDEAYLALANTAPPWELVRNKLPRLPFPAMLVRLPEDRSLQIRVTQDRPIPGVIPQTIEVRSILLVEEIPGRKWRYIGFNDAKDMEKMAFSKGYLDLGTASAKAQLVEGASPDAGFTYRESGDDQVWQLLLNLAMALNNRHLDGQQVKPKLPKSSRKAAKMRRRKSLDEYTIVRLSQASRAERDLGAKKVSTPTGRSPQRRHLRSGHWRSFWVRDPGDKPIYDSRQRTTRSGEVAPGNLYKVVSWVFPYWAGEGTGQPGGSYKVVP